MGRRIPASRKIVNALLSMVLVLGLMPVPAFAEGGALKSEVDQVASSVGSGAADLDNATSGALSNADGATEGGSAPATGASVRPYGSDGADDSFDASSNGVDTLALTDGQSDGFAPYAMAYYAVLYDSDGDGAGEKLVFQNSSLGLSKFGTKVNSWSFSEDASYSDSSKAPWYAAYSSIKSIQFNYPLSPVSLRYWFYGLSKLESIDFANLDTSAVTSMNAAFSGCSSLKALDLSSFDTSKVTDMAAMFKGCSSLAELDLSSFDTGSVTAMGYYRRSGGNYESGGMFEGCSSLKALDLSSFDTSKVTDMSRMFYDCSSLSTIYASASFDVSAVTSSDYMFLGCSRLVGGSGTAYSGGYYYSKEVARIDAPGAPGYFTTSCHPSDHNIVIIADEDICEKGGTSEVIHKCTVCGREFLHDFVELAPGHVYVTDPAVEATCMTEGLTQGMHCATCGKVLVVQKKVPMTGHTVVVDKAVAPTCTEPGLTEGSHCSVCGREITSRMEVPALGHDCSAPTVTFSDDGNTATIVWTCGRDASHTKELVVQSVSRVATTATCDAAGTTEYSVDVAAADEERGLTKGVATKNIADIPATGHAYGAPIIEFAANGRSATATWTCANDPSHVEVADCAVVSRVAKPATAATPGETTYTATAPADEERGLAGGTATKTLADIPATGSTYGAPEIVFAADGKTATATWTSRENASVKVIAECAVSARVTKPATCTDKGETTYTAFADGGGENLPAGSATKVVADIDALGHEFVGYVPNGDATCEHDGTETAACARGCGATDTRVAAGSKTPHAWGAPVILFAEDGASATAIWTCSSNVSHVKVADCAVASEVVSEASCCTAKLVRYTATTNVEGMPQGTASKTVQAAPAQGHSFGEPVIAFAGDMGSATATWTCTKDPSHVVTASCQVEKQVGSQATCFDDGDMLCVASFVADNGNLTALACEHEAIPAAGHHFQGRVCPDCGTHLGDVNGNGVVNVVDAQIAYDIAIGKGDYSNLPGYQAYRAAADVTGTAGSPDGELDASDAFRIQYVALCGWDID